MLVNHVWRRYGVNPGGVLNVVMPVVFDGYSAGPSTKDLTHDRSCARSMVEDAIITPDMVCPFNTFKKENDVLGESTEQGT
jgi:hypothetical protein